MADIYGESDSGKGMFHRATGVPFATWIRGNAGEFRTLTAYVENAKTGRTQLVRKHENSVEQYRELSDAADQLKQQLGVNREDIEAARKVKEIEQQNLEEVYRSSPLSLTPRIPTGTELVTKPLAFVPFLGNVISLYQLYGYKERRGDALERVDVSQQAIESIERFGHGLATQELELRAFQEKALQQVQADLTLLQSLETSTQKKIERLTNL